MSESIAFEIPFFDLVVMAVEEAGKSAIPGEETKLYLTYENGLSNYRIDVPIALLELQCEYHVITIPSLMELPHTERNQFNQVITYFTIIILDNFSQWAREYFAKGHNSPQESLSNKGQTASDSENIHRIIYTKNREILLNNIQIARPDFDSENDLVFSYLYEHPNVKISKSQIEKELNVKLLKDFDKIVENLGFKGDVRKIFFNVPKNSILFRNPVIKCDLE